MPSKPFSRGLRNYRLQNIQTVAVILNLNKLVIAEAIHVILAAIVILDIYTATCILGIRTAWALC